MLTRRIRPPTIAIGSMKHEERDITIRYKRRYEHNVWKKSYLYKTVSGMSSDEWNVISSLEEVALRVRRVDTPPVVDEHVEGAESYNKECRGPLCLETDSDHDASRETNDRDEQPGDAPLSTEDKPDEQEDEQDTSGEQEAEIQMSIL